MKYYSIACLSHLFDSKLRITARHCVSLYAYKSSSACSKWPTSACCVADNTLIQITWYAGGDRHLCASFFLCSFPQSPISSISTLSTTFSTTPYWWVSSWVVVCWHLRVMWWHHVAFKKCGIKKRKGKGQFSLSLPSLSSLEPPLAWPISLGTSRHMMKHATYLLEWQWFWTWLHADQASPIPTNNVYSTWHVWSHTLPWSSTQHVTKWLILRSLLRHTNITFSTQSMMHDNDTFMLSPPQELVPWQEPKILIRSQVKLFDRDSHGTLHYIHSCFEWGCASVNTVTAGEGFYLRLRKVYMYLESICMYMSTHGCMWQLLLCFSLMIKIWTLLCSPLNTLFGRGWHTSFGLCPCNMFGF